MKSFVLTPNGVKVRVPGFAEMMAVGVGGWKDAPVVYTRAAPVIEGKSWADPRPREQFGVAASIVQPAFEAARRRDLLSQVFLDQEWRAQLPGWDFTDAADRATLQQALGADENGCFSPVRDGALLEGEWTAAAFTPEQLRVKVSVYHGRDADGPVFDHFTYRVKDVAAEFGDERGPRLKADLVSARAEMEYGEAFCRRAAQALERLEMGAPQMGR